jgi:hypothetical protein
MLALLACSAGDDVADGTRGQCAEGGELNDCSDSPNTAYEACWRLVDCGAINLTEPEDYQFDFDNCVRRVQRMSEAAQQLTIACVGASTCDQLKIDTENGNDRCFLFGEN